MWVPSFGAVREHVVGGRDPRRHVLHDDRGIARDVLAEMPRGHPRLQVVAAADAGADDEGDLLAGVEILGRRGRRTDSAAVAAAANQCRQDAAVRPWRGWRDMRVLPSDIEVPAANDSKRSRGARKNGTAGQLLPAHFDTLHRHDASWYPLGSVWLIPG